MKNPFRKNTQDMTAPPTPDDLVAISKIRLAEANNRSATQLNRTTKWRGRAMVLSNTLITIAAIFFLIMVGYSLAENEYTYALLQATFALALIVPLIGIIMDNYVDGSKGRKLRRLVESELEEADKEKQKQEIKTKIDQVVETIKDVFEVDHNLEDTHDHLLTVALEKVIVQVISDKHHGEENIPKNYEPTKDDAREIEHRFKEITGHTAKVDFVGDGWAIDINTSHNKESYQPAKKSFSKPPKTEVKPTNKKSTHPIKKTKQEEK